MPPSAASFAAFRQQATGREPYPYQTRLATPPRPPSPAFPSLLSIPTGLGKTAAITLSWLWRRRHAEKAIRLHLLHTTVSVFPFVEVLQCQVS